jgi:hypothetical protein
MQLARFSERADLETLTAVIAHSQIVVAARACGRAARLPANYDDVDIAILDWIAAEGRHAGRRYLPNYLPM